MPLLYKSEKPLLGIWKMDESLEEMRTMLPERTWKELHEIDHAPHFSSESRWKEWMTSRLLLKALLGEVVGITHDASGMPRLTSTTYHISISHTRGYAAVLLAEKNRTGIDIEYRSERVKKVRSRFLSPSEEAFITLSSETEQLLICWCAKETLYKIIGIEEVDFIEHIHVRPFRYVAPQGTLSVFETKTAQQQSYTLCYRVCPEYVLTYLSP